MYNRCYNRNDARYSSYGGRGIYVSAEWRSFTVFLRDMGKCPAGLSIDRIDNDGPYSKDNCRWADTTTQNRNRTCSKLSFEKAEEIRSLHKAGVRTGLLAARFQVADSAIRKVLRGERWAK